jgi:WD40 repeat protein
LAETPADLPGLLTGLDSGQILLQDADGKLVWAGMQTSATSPRLAVSPLLSEQGAGEVVVYGDGPAEWFGYDARGAVPYTEIPPDDAEFVASGAAISPDGSLTLVAGPYIIFYESATGNNLGTIQPQDEEGQDLAVRAIRFSPDGHYLLVVTSDGKLRVWAVTTP